MNLLPQVKMVKRTSRILALLMSLIMVAVMIPAMAFAEDGTAAGETVAARPAVDKTGESGAASAESADKTGEGETAVA